MHFALLCYYIYCGPSQQIQTVLRAIAVTAHGSSCYSDTPVIASQILSLVKLYQVSRNTSIKQQYAELLHISLVTFYCELKMWCDEFCISSRSLNSCCTVFNSLSS